MLAARRAYADAARWMHAARTRKVAPGRFAAGATTGSLAAGIVIMALYGLVSPSRFGVPAGRGFTNLGAVVLVAAIAVAGAYLALRARTIAHIAVRLRDPFTGPLEGEYGYEGVTGALEACPAALRTRFAISWVWVPLLVALLATMCALASAYFLVDAILQRFAIGPGQAVYLFAFAVASAVLWRIGAPRLSTWRLAMSAHRAAAGYV